MSKMIARRNISQERCICAVNGGTGTAKLLCLLTVLYAPPIVSGGFFRLTRGGFRWYSRGNSNDEAEIRHSGHREGLHQLQAGLPAGTEDTPSELPG